MNKGKFTLLIIITTFIMGSSIAVVKVGLEYSSPLLLAALRFIFAGLILTVFVLVFKRKHPKTVQDWMKLMIIGIFQSTGVSVGIFVSLRTISASESSILIYTSPIFVVIFGILFFQMHFKIWQWTGVVIGIIGVVVTLNAQMELKIGVLFGFLAAICWAMATLLAKRWGELYDIWVLSAYQMLFGGLLLLLGSIILEKAFFIINFSSFFVVFWLVVIASIIQYALWYYLLQKKDAGKTSSFLFLAPAFGVLTGWLVLNEPLYISFAIGGSLIILGIYLVNKDYKSEK